MLLLYTLCTIKSTETNMKVMKHIFNHIQTCCPLRKYNYFLSLWHIHNIISNWLQFSTCNPFVQSLIVTCFSLVFFLFIYIYRWILLIIIYIIDIFIISTNLLNLLSFFHILFFIIYFLFLFEILIILPMFFILLLFLFLFNLLFNF